MQSKIREVHILNALCDQGRYEYGLTSWPGAKSKKSLHQCFCQIRNLKEGVNYLPCCKQRVTEQENWGEKGRDGKLRDYGTVRTRRKEKSFSQGFCRSFASLFSEYWLTSQFAFLVFICWSICFELELLGKLCASSIG